MDTTITGPRERWLQRAPILCHLALIPFAILGPTYAPLLFAAFSFGVHAVLLGVNSRTIYGTLRAWQGVKKHSQTDWAAEYTRGRAALGHNDVLPYDEVEHLIVVPNYEEDISVLRETLDILASHPLSHKYHPVLAMEGRERGARTKAEQLLGEFIDRGCFASVSYTLHPGTIYGEAAGKSSNLSWAVRQAWYTVLERGGRCAEAKTVVTVLDSDTALAGDYFASISTKFALRAATERSRMYFIPPIVFDRNAHDVPVTVRLVDMLWAMAGLSCIYPGSVAKIPTSAYSLSLSLAASIGFWDSGPEAIGEDMHMALKALFCTGGNVIAETIYSPASQLDIIAADRKGLRGLYNDHIARYKQAVRHLWGSLDTGYMLNRFWCRSFQPCEQDFVSVQRQGSPVGTLSLSGPEGHDFGASGTAWVDTVSSSSPSSGSTTPSGTSSDMSPPLETITEENTSVSELELEMGEKDLLVAHAMPAPAKINPAPFVVLCMRLYEAHLLMGQMTILSVVRVLRTLPEILSKITSPADLVPVPVPVATGSAVWIGYSDVMATWLGPIFFFLTLAMILAYGQYHQAAAKDRWRTPGAAARLGIEPSMRSYRPLLWSPLDVLALPGAFFFGCLPAFHAQLMHLVTIKLKYTVSFKPASNPAVKPKTGSNRDLEKGLGLVA